MTVGRAITALLIGTSIFRASPTLAEHVSGDAGEVCTVVHESWSKYLAAVTSQNSQDTRENAYAFAREILLSGLGRMPEAKREVAAMADISAQDSGHALNLFFQVASHFNCTQLSLPGGLY